MIGFFIAMATFVGDPARPAHTAPRPEPFAPAEEHGKLPWFQGNFAKALEEAKAKQKIVFVDVWRDNCPWCTRLSKDTFSDASVVTEMQDMLCFNIDGQSADGRPLAQRWNVQGFPTLVFLSPDGAVRDRIPGYLPPDKFKAAVKRIRSDEGTVGDLKRRVAKDPSSIDAHYALAQKLLECGDGGGNAAEIAAIQKLDPDGKSLALRKVAFDEVMERINTGWQSTQTLEMRELFVFLETETYPEILFEGWGRVNRMKVYQAGEAANRGDQEGAQKLLVEARDAARKSWKHCPDDRKAEIGNMVASDFWQARSSLSKEEKAFALEVARDAQRAAGDDSAALDTLACCLYMNGMKDEAIKTLQRCIELSPGNKELEKRLSEWKS